MTISLGSWTAAEERAARGLAAADLGLTMKAAADSFPAGILSPSSARTARWALLSNLGRLEICSQGLRPNGLEHHSACTQTWP